MRVEAWRATSIPRGLILVSRLAPVRSLRIESFENEPAVVAEQFMHPHHSEEKHRIIVIALNPFTLASWTLHAVHSNRLCVIMRMMEDSNENLTSAHYKDPLIEAFKKDVDVTLIRENLRLTVDQRFQQLMKMQEVAEELRRAGRKARSQK
jgi:hypothetical protein